MKIQMMQNNEVALVHVSQLNAFLIHPLNLFLADIPQKRVDRHRSNGTNIGQSPNSNTFRPGVVSQLAEGSPLVPRRQLYSNIR
jgi:hypothetical protein